jgi:uncharacterized protein YqjF (DUF2071 family)
MPKIFLSAQWEHLVMANYAVAPETLQPYLPNGLQLDDFQGTYYLSLVGFMFRNTRLFGLPVPFFGSFEEINLRFYVKRHTEQGLRRGVVFINETVPFRAVAWLANTLYKEHYTCIPTQHLIQQNDHLTQVRYMWQHRNKQNFINVAAENTAAPMIPGSVEAFIFEHYYGYTKVGDTQTEEYGVLHPSWNTHRVLHHEINCDFSSMYGAHFGFLNEQQPKSVLLAAGSEVQVAWKRHRIQQP